MLKSWSALRDSVLLSTKYPPGMALPRTACSIVAGMRLEARDGHYPVCRLDIRQDSEFATRYGYPKTAFKREPDTDPDIRNAFIDNSRIQTFGKSYTLQNHSFIFRSTFSAFCAMTPSLYTV